MRKIEVATDLIKMETERNRLQKMVQDNTPGDIGDPALDAEAVLKKINDLDLKIQMHKALSEPKPYYFTQSN